MILIDANVFMYAAGREHPHKSTSVELLRRVASGALVAATDAEVLQEILHRYTALGRRSDGNVVYSLARDIVPETLAVDAATVDLARDLMGTQGHVTARDAVHAAVCIRNRLEGICTFDSDFDRIREVDRLDPEALVGLR